MKVREALGVDFRGDRLNVAQVRQEDVPHHGAARSELPGSRPVLTHWGSQAVPAGAESAAVAAVLRKLLDDGGFTATAAVLGLPRGRGFLRCQAAGQEEMAAFSPTDYVVDSWRTDDGREVLGVASRADVTRLVEIAHQASLQPVAVELPGLGCVTALGMLGESAAQGAMLGVVLGESDATAALVDGQVLLAVQTRLRQHAAGLDRWDSALTSVEQMFRLLAMAHPGVTTAQARVMVNSPDRQAAKNLADRLGVPVQLVRPGADRNLSFEGGELAEPAEYAAAIGLALEGLEEIAAAVARGRRARPVGHLNFLLPRRQPRRRRALSRRHAAAAGAAAAVVALVAVAGYALQRHGRLEKLQAEYDQLSPALQQRRQAERRWQAIGPWLGEADGGQRISHRRTYDAITELFPAEDAYVQSLGVHPAEAGGEVSVALNGRARDRNVVHDFVSELNRSPMFARAGLGPMVEDAEDPKFPTRFSVTFYLRRRG